MKNEEFKQVKNSIGRLAFVILAVLIQAGWFAVLFLKLNRYSTAISICSSILATVVVLTIYGRNKNAAFKMPWIILILAVPVTGLFLYLIMGLPGMKRVLRKRIEEADRSLEGILSQDEQVTEELRKTDLSVAGQAHYIWNYGKYPMYRNTDVVFYGDAAEGFEAQLQELKKAEKFIFLEYHAIEEAQAFGRMKAVLAERAKAGVEVRIIYDDMGSIGFINKDFMERMKEIGVSCRVFNPIFPVLDVVMNNRDHRKITVIDGKVGFTGGYNLADEYFNITHPYGQWKDSGVKLVGDAVKSLTVMFLEMWNAMEHTDLDMSVYFPENRFTAAEQGFVQPYADSPMDGEPVGENVYMNVIRHAKKYLYIVTPYLIISDEMNRELGLAAKRGVDVRIITPGIPDKKMVFKVTRSYYAALVAAGVRIYEYTPGFIHAKQMVCDDEIATVGTINLDYRSLYLHFENGVLLYRCQAVNGVKQDFLDTFPVCHEVTEEYGDHRSRVLRIGQCMLRLIAPLL